MTEIILSFPVRRTLPLRCVWFETGDRNHTLSCKWVAAERADTDIPPSFADKPIVFRVCA